MSRTRAFVMVAAVLCTAWAFAQMPTGPWPPLVPCDEVADGPCTQMVTSADEMAGVWRQVLVNPILQPAGNAAYVRYRADGTFSVAPEAVGTAGPYGAYPHGRIAFEGDVMTFAVEGEGVPPECRTATYQVQVLLVDGRNVALILQPIEDACPGRLASVTVPLIWVGE